MQRLPGPEWQQGATSGASLLSLTQPLPETLTSNWFKCSTVILQTLPLSPPVFSDPSSPVKVAFPKSSLLPTATQRTGDMDFERRLLEMQELHDVRKGNEWRRHSSLREPRIPTSLPTLTLISLWPPRSPEVPISAPSPTSKYDQHVSETHSSESSTIGLLRVFLASLPVKNTCYMLSSVHLCHQSDRSGPVTHGGILN